MLPAKTGRLSLRVGLVRGSASAELEQLRSSFAWKTVASVVRAIDAVPASSAGNCKLTVSEKCWQLAFF